MNNEIKEILEFLSNENYYIQDIDCKFKRLYLDEVKTLLDYITNLQEENSFLKLNNPEMNIEHFRIVKENKRKIDILRKENKRLKEENKRLKEENERLKEIAHKMHLWIFLHSGDEQKVYDEIGLTEEENAMLGYSGQFILQGENKE